MAKEKLLANSRRNLSAAQREARQKAEDLVISNPTKPKQNEIVKSHTVMKKIFNQIRKLNDHFTEADSISLNTLVFNLYMKAQNEQKLSTLHLEDDQYERYVLRIEKFNKMINESMKQLCLPLNARLTLANDMAKVMIEEKKLQQITGQQPKEVNPLFALLEGVKQMNK